MEILEFTELNPVTLKMRIKVATGAIAREYDMVLADFIRNSNIQGFRPGKAPRKLVEIKVGSSEILRIARDKASHDAFKQALEKKDLSSVAEPIYEHTDYNGEGDYEFSVIFNPQPPSPDELLSSAKKPDRKMIHPEDHLPKGFEHQSMIMPTTGSGAWADMDHGHVAGGSPVDSSIESQLSLPGSPQMHPKLPIDLDRVLKPGAMIPESDNGLLDQKSDLRRDPEDEIPEDVKKLKTSEPFKIREGSTGDSEDSTGSEKD